MTQSLKMFTGILVLTVVISTSSVGQGIYAGNSTKNKISPLSINEALDANRSILSPALQSNFAVLFPVAASEKWSSSADHFWVSFVNDGRNAKGSFTKKGKLTYLITDCNMDQLPAQFSKTISKDYSDYRLFNAIEIKAHGATAYQTVLENAKGFVTLKYTDDGVELIQQVSK